MELGIADLKPFLPGLEAVLDDEDVSEVMVNGRARSSWSVAGG